MSWQGFLNGTGNVARIIGLAIVNILMFLLNLTFMVVKVCFFLIVSMLTLGKLGMSTVDYGERRR